MAEFIKGDFDIAVIGLACRFPGAENQNEFWENLCAGRDCITRDDKLSSADGTYIGAYGKIRDKYLFADKFFNIPKEQAAMTDPQQRIFTETVYEALLDAGCEETEGKTGIFAGSDEFGYVWSRICRNGYDRSEYIKRSSMLHGSFVSKISYRFNFTGVSMTLCSACATSSAAVHFAANALLNYECDICIAGGVSVAEDDEGYSVFKNTLSTDGYTRAFDMNATGFVPGNGSGAVVLKRLEDAVADRNRIYAVIRGSAINNDGNEKAGYTSPSYKGQSEAIRSAYEISGVDTGKVDYVECHGTGTVLGDALELKAIGDVLSGNRQCRVGSVKSNIGHTGAASGIASFIKAVLMIYHKKFVPTLYCDTPNEALSEQHLTPSDKYRNWNSETRIAGINSFGIGGTNCHIIIEGYDEERRTETSGCGVFLLSGDSPDDLEWNYKLLEKYFGTEEKTNVADAAYTLLKGRKKKRFRFAAVVNHDRITMTSGVTDTEETEVEKVIFSLPDRAEIPDELRKMMSAEGKNISGYEELLKLLTDCDETEVRRISETGATSAENTLVLDIGNDTESFMKIICELWKYNVLNEEELTELFLRDAKIVSLPFRFREKEICFEER